ncbi:MAG: hypothetical protein P1P82_02190 [Bacteroidales bacterium]|nr:hypothetical protein [Bacteroidales bacterium]MDT8433038.1 hypothetical protein [Bacteroidales bacterium]
MTLRTIHIKTTIYISGFVAAFLLLGWLTALLMGMSAHLLMLAAGSVVFLFVYLPLVMKKRKIQRERMQAIIQKYQNDRDTVRKIKLQKEPGHEVSGEKTTKKKEGWTMNDSPFRERNTDVTWGGGNIHAANVSRGSRKRRK